MGAPLPSQVIEVSGIRKVELYPIELLLVQHSDMETALTIQFSHSDSLGESGTNCYLWASGTNCYS